MKQKERLYILEQKCQIIHYKIKKIENSLLYRFFKIGIYKLIPLKEEIYEIRKEILIEKIWNMKQSVKQQNVASCSYDHHFYSC